MGLSWSAVTELVIYEPDEFFQSAELSFSRSICGGFMQVFCCPNNEYERSYLWQF